MAMIKPLALSNVTIAGGLAPKCRLRQSIIVPLKCFVEATISGSLVHRGRRLVRRFIKPDSPYLAINIQVKMENVGTVIGNNLD